MGEDNDRTLKLSVETDAQEATMDNKTMVETSEMATIRMAEQAGEQTSKVSYMIGKE